jgi:hypothetical protein
MDKHELLYNFEPIVIDDVFTQEEYDSVYNSVNAVFPKELSSDVPPDSGYFNAGEIGYFAYTKGFEHLVYQKIVDLTKEYGHMNVLETRVHFARYTPKTGFPPMLRPHNDLGVETSALTFSVQLDSTFDWELCAVDSCVTLKKNQAMLFSGSHQIHWRPKKEFGPEDYFDIMVCQMYVDTELLSKEHEDKMFDLKLNTIEKYFQLNPEMVNNLPRHINMENMLKGQKSEKN